MKDTRGYAMNKDKAQNVNDQNKWPKPPRVFPPIMTATEAAQYLRLDCTNHTPESAKRTLTYWREHRQLNATKYARHVWYLKHELDKFLILKTEKESR